MSGREGQSFLKGAVILSSGMVLVRFLGLFYSIPLQNAIDVTAMSYFYTAYDIFSFFLLVSTSGLPVTVSKMVGVAVADGDYKKADKILKIALSVFVSLGIVMACVMFFGADLIAGVYGIPGASSAIKALSPTVFFISIMSALRGYFQGRSNMVPTAVSQVIEAFSKIMIGLSLAFFILNTTGDHPAAATAAVAGVSASAALGTIYLVGYKIYQKRKDINLTSELAEEHNNKELLNELVKFAIPITLGSCFLSLLDIADSAIWINRMQSVGYTNEDTEWFKGIYGNAKKFFDLPGSFITPISASLLPVLSSAVAKRDESQILSVTSASFRITFLISMPAGVAMIIFAEPICSLLLMGNPEAAVATAPVLSILSIAILFIAVIFITNAMIQSFGDAKKPVIHMATGSIIKLAITYFLVVIPQINVLGVAISTVVSYFIITMLNVRYIKKYVPEWQGFWKTAVPPLISAVVMGAISYAFYYVLTLLIPSQVSIIITIPFAMLVYAVIATKFKAIRYEDVVTLPKGTMIARVLKLRP